MGSSIFLLDILEAAPAFPPGARGKGLGDVLFVFAVFFIGAGNSIADEDT